MKFFGSLSNPRILACTVGIFLLSVYGFAWLIFDTPLAFWRPADDAYYYFDTVRSLVNGLGISTDGIHETSGFHPLWFIVLLPFGLFLREPNDGLVIASQMLSMGMLAISIGVIASALKRSGINSVAASIGGASLLFAPWRGVASAGVEGALALMGLCFFVWLALGLLQDLDNQQLQISTGVVAGFTVLARLDSVILLGSTIALILIKLWSSKGRNLLFQASIPLIGVPALLVGLYLSTNFLRTGQLMPITASLKSSFPTAKFNPQFLFSNFEYVLAPIVCWGSLAFTKKGPLRTLCFGLSLGSTAFLLYLSLFGQGVFWWHFVSVLPAGALGSALFTDYLLRISIEQRYHAMLRSSISVIAALILIVPFGTSLAERSPDGAHYASSGWRVETALAGRWVTDNLPASALLAMKDSGAFGYYSEQPVMNLDGVISDRDFNDALCKGSAVENMALNNVLYVAHHRVRSDYEIFELRLPCWTENTSPSVLIFEPSDEVYRGDAHFSGGPDRHFVIWAWTK